VPLAKSHSAHRKRSALLLTSIKLIIQLIKKCREIQERWRKKIHIRYDFTKLVSDPSTLTDRRNFAPTNQKDEAMASGTRDSQCRNFKKTENRDEARKAAARKTTSSEHQHEGWMVSGQETTFCWVSVH
jgi:hypothetical protein